MYTNIQQNQAKNTNKVPFLGTLSENSYNGNITAYISTLTKTQKRIAKVILKYRNAKDTILTNEYVADKADCCTKTVTRATAKFHQDNFVTKHQDNPYSPNHYKFNEKVKKGTDAMNYWLNELTPTNQDLYKTHGIIIDHKNKVIVTQRNVPQNYNYSYLDSYITGTESLTRARARPVTVEKPKKKDQGEHFAMKPEQRKWILGHRHDPRVKEMLLTDEKVRAALFTPEMLKVAELLALDERERLKMIAFPKESIKYSQDYIASVVSGSKKPKKPVEDRLGWLIGILSAFCSKNNIKPDWGWYFDIADITGLKHDSSTESKRPLEVKKTVTVPRKEGMYATWVSPEKESLEKLVQRIEGLEKTLASNTAPDFMVEYLRNALANAKLELEAFEGQIAQS